MSQTPQWQHLRVVVLSDQAVLRAAMVALLDGQVAIGRVVEATEPAAADRQVREIAADVVLVADIGVADTIETIGALQELHCPAPALVMGTDGSVTFVRGSIAAGAGGVVPMSATVSELVDALRRVAARSPYVHPRLGAVLAQSDPTRVLDTLSSREREVLRLIALGYTNPEIAAALVVSVRTVETHRAHLVGKLNASTRAQLVRHAIDNGLLSTG